jgi:hypothetical protein
MVELCCKQSRQRSPDIETFGKTVLVINLEAMVALVGFVSRVGKGVLILKHLLKLF